MWRNLRIAILLLILLLVAGGTLVDRLRTTSWDHTLWVGVFPINGDGRAATERYIASLDHEQFIDIESFFREEANSWGVKLDQPVRVELYPQVREAPPRLDPRAGMLGRLWWSLKVRYYTWRIAGDTLADIRVFVLYHDPQHTLTVPHSLGLQKGLLGIVYAFAERQMNAENGIVIAHEVLHTLGATDKYDLGTNLPLFPDGYGDPEAQPRYPQQFAEIMAGRTAVSPTAARMPASLDEVVVGRATALEIRWIDP